MRPRCSATNTSRRLLPSGTSSRVPPLVTNGPPNKCRTGDVPGDSLVMSECTKSANIGRLPPGSEELSATIGMGASPHCHSFIPPLLPIYDQDHPRPPAGNYV